MSLQTSYTRFRCERWLNEVMWFGEEGGNQPASCGERQPYSGNRTVAGNVNQISAKRGRESAEDGGGQAVGQSEAGSTHIHGHNLGEEDDHRAVVAPVEK